MEEKKFRFATVLRRWDIANRILLILRMRYRNAGFSFAGLQRGAVPPFVGSIGMSQTGSCCHCNNTTEAHSAVFARIGTFFGSFIKLMFPFVGSIRMSRTGIGCQRTDIRKLYAAVFTIIICHIFVPFLLMLLMRQFHIDFFCLTLFKSHNKLITCGLSSPFLRHSGTFDCFIFRHFANQYAIANSMPIFFLRGNSIYI